MSSSKSNAVIHPVASGLFRAYPWANGVALAPKREEFIKKELGELEHGEEVVEMLEVSNSCGLLCRS